MRRRVVVSVDSAKDAIVRTDDLRRAGFLRSLDIMVEDIETMEMVQRIHKAYMEILEHTEPAHACNIVIKPTALGLGLAGYTQKAQADVFASLLEALLTTVLQMNSTRERKVGIEIDVESTKTASLAMHVVAELRQKFPLGADVLRVAIPMHMRGLDGLCTLYNLLGHPVRIVKGAGVYNEPKELLVVDDVVPFRYEAYFLKCLAEGTHPYIATMHDEKLLHRVIASARSYGFTEKDFVIQMLYGLWMGLGRKLVNDGYAVSIYIPIVFPWCTNASRGYVRRRVRMFRTLTIKWFVSIFTKP